jgi:hypothetical protein
MFTRNLWSISERKFIEFEMRNRGKRETKNAENMQMLNEYPREFQSEFRKFGEGMN